MEQKFKRRPWSSEELEFLKQSYADQQCETIALKVNHPKSGVYRMARILGLEKSEAFKKSPLSGGFQKGSVAGAAFRFKKGQISHNKGKKIEDYMSKAGIEASKNTRFKSGNLPHNTRTDGEQSIRTDKSGKKYIYVRTALAKWEMLHVINWRKKYGEVPKGKILFFIDGNSLNCEVDNLKLITRAESMALSRQSDGTIASYLSGRNKTLANELLNNPALLDLKRQQLNLKNQLNGKL